MALPTYDQRMLIRNPFGPYYGTNSVPAVAVDLYDQEFPAFGRYNASLVFKNLFDFTRYDDDTLNRADGLTTPGSVVLGYATFMFAGSLRGLLAVDDSFTLTASALTGETVIVDDDGADVATVCTAELLGGSFYEKRVEWTHYDFDYSISARSIMQIAPPVVSSPFRLYYQTNILPATGVQLIGSTMASWSYGGYIWEPFSESVAPTLYGTPSGDDMYVLTLEVYCHSYADDDVEVTASGSVLGASSDASSKIVGSFDTYDAQITHNTSILTSLSWPPGDMSVSGTGGGSYGISATLSRVRVALYNDGYWNYAM